MTEVNKAELTQHGDQPPVSPRTDTVGRATRRGVAWSASSKILIQILQFGTTVVLARLLTPGDYGLVAIVLTFVGFAQLFTDLGLGAAVIHRPRLDQPTLSTAFWLNAGSGFALTALFCGLAYPISLLYGQPKLTWLVITGSLSFSLAMYAVHLALLERSMSFRTIASIEFSGAVCFTVVAVVTAVGGLGPYSLIVGSLTQAALKTVLMWNSVRWWPSWTFTRAALRELWQYSGHLFGFNVINYWSRNSDNLLIGKFLGAAVLGSYARAYNLMMLPVQQVTGVVGRVLFPAFTKLRDDENRLREAYLRSVRVMASISAPLSLTLAASAGPFVSVVYGSRWDAVAPVLALLALSGPAQVISGTFGAVYQALGMTKVMFRRGIWATLITVAAIAIGLHWGVKGVALALLIKFWILMPLNGRPMWTRLGASGVRVIGQLWPVAFSCAFMYGAARGVSVALDGYADWLVLLSDVATCLLAYLIAMGFLGRRILLELHSALTGRRSPRVRPHVGAHVSGPGHAR